MALDVLIIRRSQYLRTSDTISCLGERGVENFRARNKKYG